MIAIINASPLIYLGKLGALYVLPKLYSKCFTTSKVKDEVLYKKNVPEYPILDESFSDWLNIKQPKDQSFQRRLEEMQIHPGEASIIALGKELEKNQKESIIIIDDFAAREIARTLGLNITGTIGVIFKSMESTIITKDKCKEFIQNLVENTDFRISAKFYSKIIKQINSFGKIL